MMRVIVKDGSIALYEYDTGTKEMHLSPAMADKPDVRQALRMALKYLGKDDPPKDEVPFNG
jgi:hypothetical protein